MNHLQTLHTEYLQPNRTIETILVTKGTHTQTVWVYNDEGLHFRVFDSLIALFDFLNTGSEPEQAFDSEQELDAFLVSGAIWYTILQAMRSIKISLNNMQQDRTKQLGLFF